MTSSQIVLPQIDPWQELAGYCATEVVCAPKTWGDPLRESHVERPQNLQGVVNYVQNNLVGHPWGNHLVLLAAVLHSQNIQYKTVMNHLCQLHRGFGDLFSALKLQSMTQWDVDKYLPLYFSGQILAKDTSSQRITFWSSYQAGSRHMKRWLTSLPMEQQGWYRQYVLPYPDDPHELTRMSGGRRVVVNACALVRPFNVGSPNFLVKSW